LAAKLLASERRVLDDLAAFGGFILFLHYLFLLLLYFIFSKLVSILNKNIFLI
jgi:hypothetical protein